MSTRDATLQAELAQARKDAAAWEARFKWLANAALYCDYGDNHYGAVGWNVRRDVGLIVHGMPLVAGLDAAMLEPTP